MNYTRRDHHSRVGRDNFGGIMVTILPKIHDPEAFTANALDGLSYGPGSKTLHDIDMIICTFESQTPGMYDICFQTTENTNNNSYKVTNKASVKQEYLQDLPRDFNAGDIYKRIIWSNPTYTYNKDVYDQWKNMEPYFLGDDDIKQSRIDEFDEIAQRFIKEYDKIDRKNIGQIFHRPIGTTQYVNKSGNIQLKHQKVKGGRRTRIKRRKHHTKKR
jgi:hypothetical protein